MVYVYDQKSLEKIEFYRYIDAFHSHHFKMQIWQYGNSVYMVLQTILPEDARHHTLQ